jgi:hypothetical protein
LKAIPNNFTYSLMGEEWCNPDFRSAYTPARYEKWLQKRHGDIAALNKAWGTSYKSFAEAAGKESLQTKGGHYDWYTFNEDRLTTFNRWQIDGAKSEDPEALTVCWPAAGCLVSCPLGGFDPRYGRNREDILWQGAVMGWDGGIFAYEAGESTHRLDKSHWAKYILGWCDEMIYYDFAKSVCPEKPICDPELHSITSVYHMSPMGVSADYLRTSLWMEHLHGLGAHLLWWWGRKEDGTPYYGEFLGGLLTQPQLLESWGRTVLELRRLTEYVVLFPQLERKARILYSEASAIQDGKAYPQELAKVYEALYFLDYPVGFVTEGMVREGKLRDCALLVIPGAKYVNGETASKIEEYQAKGGWVVVTGADIMRYDEYGKERQPADSAKRWTPLPGSTAEEYSAQLEKVLDEVGIDRPVRALGKDGKRVWGVELRTASQNGNTILYLINVNHNRVEIALRSRDGKREARDLVGKGTISLGDSFVLEPRKPMLLELF